MRYLALALAFLAACAKPLSYVEYREPGGEFSVQVPVGWHLDERGPFTRRPVAEVWWLGEMTAQHEGWPIGVMLFVRRLDRNPDPRATVFKKFDLALTDAMFTDAPPEGMVVTTLEHSGYPARLVVNDNYVPITGDNLFHGKVKEYPSRLHALIIRTPDFYYVLEYRAVRDRFEKYKPAFDTLVASFKLTKAPPPAKTR